MEDHAEHSKQEAASRREHGHRGNQGPHSSFEKKVSISSKSARHSLSISFSLFTADGGTALAYNRVFRLTLDRTS
jgi:hypothetical protein